MSKIHTDRKHYVPTMNGERQFYLASKRGKQYAIKNAEHSEDLTWEELEKQGWTIEEFWGSEYE